MFRSWSQTIARPLGVIELQKWLLRITAFFFKFPKETWWPVLHFRPAGRSQVVISRVLEQNPFLKDCFQNKAPASNYIDIPCNYLKRSFSKCIPSISIFLRILARLSVQLWCSAMKNLKFPSLEAKKNNFLITSLQTKGLAWYALLFAVLISSVIVFDAIMTSLEVIALIFLEDNVAIPKSWLLTSLFKVLWKSH